MILRADQHAGAKHHALGLELLDTAVDQRLLHLEVGDAVAQQAADAVVLLEHGDVVAGARELCAAAGRAGADHGDLPAVLTSAGCGTTQPFPRPCR